MLICDNLRGFLISRPPLVLFLLILGSFSIVLFVVNYIVGHTELQNPDEEDWNSFLSGFKDVKFCIMNNSTDPEHSSKDSEHIGLQPIKEVVSNVHNKLQGQGTSNKDLVTAWLPFRVSLTPTNNSVDILLTASVLTASVDASLLGVEGSSGKLNLRLQLPQLWNKSSDASKCCQAIHTHTCIEIRAPSHLLPSRISPQCDVVNTTVSNEHHLNMIADKPNQDDAGPSPCKSELSLVMAHDSNPDLNIMLTLQDKTEIGLHILHTAYFLFIMVVTILCFAIIKGKSQTSNSNTPRYREVNMHDEND